MEKNLLILLVAVMAYYFPAKTQDHVLFSETFDDYQIDKRGWYDGTASRISEKSRQGKGCIEYEWIKGTQQVQGSSPQRHLFKPVEEVYIRYYLRLSEGWKWSGVNWHPHLTHFMTTENGEFDGPAATHLTLYIEPVNGKLRLAAQDIQNEHTPSGLTQGPLKGGYNGILYDSKEQLFKDDKWHCIEAYFKLNTLDIKAGVPVKDGIVRAWFDGEMVIDHTTVILRSADFPNMKLNQFLMAPYFGPGLLNNSQKLWIDELVVSSERPGPLASSTKMTESSPLKEPVTGICFFTDSSWISSDRDLRFTYGLNINSPWENGGTLFMHFPEHLEYNPVGNTILRHYDSIPTPWIISPDRLQASYRVESPALKDVVVESFARRLNENELPAGATGVKLAMHITNNGTITLPVIRPLICMQYSGLNGFPQKLKANYEHNFIIIKDNLISLSVLTTSDPNTTFKGSVVAGSPQRDTRSEVTGGLIEQDMDLALSVVTSMDNKRKVIFWWTPGKSMIANANIPCIHADPYFGTLRPGQQAYAEGMIIFTEADTKAVIDFIKDKDRKVF
jgi:hypothetical protein